VNVRRPQGWVGAVALLGAGVVAVGLVAVVALTVGFGGDEPTSTRPPQPDVSSSSTNPAPTAADGLVDVELVAPSDDGFVVPATVGGLAEASVLSVVAKGFPADSTGQAVQCAVTGAVDRCANRISVRFDDEGVARFQYLIRPDVDALACGPDHPCSVVVAGDAGEPAARVATVFGAPAAGAPGVAVTPQRRLTDGDVVRVQLEGFVPGTRVAVVQCVAPALSGRRGCGAPGPVVEVAIDHRGRATTSVTVRAGKVGAAGHSCDRRHACALVVLGGSTVAASPQSLSFSASAGAGYWWPRVLTGAAVAAALLLAVTWLVRTTDWSPPSEAATPGLDSLDLTAD